MTRRARRQADQHLVAIRETIRETMLEVLERFIEDGQLLPADWEFLSAENDRLTGLVKAVQQESTRRLEKATGLAAKLNAAEADLAQAQADLQAARDDAEKADREYAYLNREIQTARQAKLAFFAAVREALGCDIGANILGLIHDLKENTDRWREDVDVAEQCLAASVIARAELAQRLEDAETALASEKALSAKLDNDLDAALAQIETLKSQLAKPCIPPAGQRTEAGPTIPPLGGPASIRLTALAAQIKDLHAKGNNARRICTILNNRLEPACWMNEVGVAAILDLVHGGAA